MMMTECDIGRRTPYRQFKVCNRFLVSLLLETLMSVIPFKQSDRLSLLDRVASPEELPLVRRISPKARTELEVALEEDRRAGLLVDENEKLRPEKVWTVVACSPAQSSPHRNAVPQFGGDAEESLL